MKHFIRNPQTGQFTTQVSLASRPSRSTRTINIVSGRLYGYRGIPVRAFGLVAGKRYVAAHKVLTGLVNDNELTKLTKPQVAQYLQQVEI